MDLDQLYSDKEPVRITYGCTLADAPPLQLNATVYHLTPHGETPVPCSAKTSGNALVFSPGELSAGVYRVLVTGAQIRSIGPDPVEAGFEVVNSGGGSP